MAQLIGNRYELIEQIGAGGMGTVYRGVDTQTRQSVAVKQLRVDVSSPEMIERFKREGEALRQLNHPNIVKILDTVAQDGEQYLVLEYVDGGDMGSLIRREQLSVDRVLSLALELADALTRAHHLKIIHRDLKPANVLIAGDGTPRLTDFGIARVGDVAVTQSGVVIGTFPYLPPEAFSGATLDARADLWAFGVMLFEMLAGRRPFEGESPSAIIGAILNQRTPNLEALRSDAPVALLDLIYRLLEKNREQRIPSARQVGAEMEAILNKTRMPVRSVASVPITIITPPKSANQIPNNLPVQTSAFIGRELELTRLKDLLGDTNKRLISIVGIGGIGKSSLAIEAARAQVKLNGTYFVPLASVSQRVGIIATIAQVLGYQLVQEQRSPETQLLGYLAEKQILLILDNFEHLVETSDLLVEIEHLAPNIKLLITSRQRLNLSSETVVALDGLAISSSKQVDVVLNSDAVKLFVEGAKRVSPEFEANASNAFQLAHLCQLVNGSPLAILLATSWINTLSLDDIAAEISHNYHILETQQRDVPQRQRSIRAVFEYAWNLLTEDERNVLMKMSVFVGGCSRRSAQDITGASLYTLNTLINKALVHRLPESGRYTMHELLRQYAEEALIKSGQMKATYTAYGTHYIAGMNHFEVVLKSEQQADLLSKPPVDIGNANAALRWAIREGNIELVGEALDAAVELGIIQGSMQELLSILQFALDHFGEIQNDAVARLWARVVARIAMYFPPTSMTDENLEKAHGILQRTMDTYEIGYCLAAMGRTAAIQQRYQDAIPLLEQGAMLFRGLKDDYALARTLPILSAAYGSADGLVDALRTAQESVDLCRLKGDKYHLAQSLQVLAGWVNFSDKYRDAERIYIEAHTIQREINDNRGAAFTLARASTVKMLMGEFQMAYKSAEQSLSEGFELNDPATKARSMMILAWFYVVNNQNAKSIQLVDECRNLPFVVPDYVLQFLLEILPGYAYCGLRNDVHAHQHAIRSLKFLKRVRMPVIIAAVFALYGLIEASAGREQQAITLLAAAVGRGVSASWIQKWSLISQIQTELKLSIGVETFDLLWNAGLVVSVDEIIAQLFEKEKIG